MTDPRDTRIAELEETARVAVDQFERMDVNLRRCSDERNADALRIAELENEVARYRWFHAAVLAELGNEETSVRSLVNIGYAAHALDGKPPIPPAPMAQERGARFKAMVERAGPLETTLLAGSPTSEETWREDPKPPEVEEPGVVRNARKMLAGPKCSWKHLGANREDAEALLAFIDSRKAEMVRDDLDRELAERVGRHTLQIDQLVRDHIDEMTAAEQERDRLRAELAGAKAAAEQVGDQWRAAAQELYALEARPVVDVAKALPLLRELRESLSRERCMGWGALLDEALESLQPASAKADEQPSADPARVGEEERHDAQQVARLELAHRLVWAKPFGEAPSPTATFEICRQVVEYLRAEREGRKEPLSPAPDNSP